MSNMHKICGSKNYIEIVINNSSRYYNMFSYINLGFYQTWDEFLRELQLIHKSQTVIFFGKFDFLWCFSIYPSMSYFEELIHESSFSKSSDLKRIFTYFIHHLKVITSLSNASTMFVYFQIWILQNNSYLDRLKNIIKNQIFQKIENLRLVYQWKFVQELIPGLIKSKIDVWKHIVIPWTIVYYNFYVILGSTNFVHIRHPKFVDFDF